MAKKVNKVKKFITFSFGLAKGGGKAGIAKDIFTKIFLGMEF